MAAMRLTLVSYLTAAASFTVTVAAPCDTPEEGFQCSTNVSRSWGQYSPFFAVDSEIDAAVPDGCQVTFAQILSRHGARDPTAKKSKKFNATVTKIHSSVTQYGPGFEFIKDYEYTLGADQLTVFGQQELVNSGIAFFERYGALVSNTSLPFIRTAGQDRVVMSAQNWTQGFFQAAGIPLSDPNSVMLVIPEGDDFNNTLDHSICTAFEEGVPFSTISDDARDQWAAVFVPPIAARLNANLRGMNFSTSETLQFLDLCPFNTVASDNGTLSPFCTLFSASELADYDYYQSLGKWYGQGPGNPLGPTQGVGFVNELVARLTGQPVTAAVASSINRTLDASDETFPLGRALYADFSHDSDMVAIAGALGLYGAPDGSGAQLSNTTRMAVAAAPGRFSTATVVPFAARFYFEKMTCGDGDGEELVRILVNDRVVPLQECGADELGRCELGKFVDSLSFATSGGRWDMCFQ